jgi:hypothetical protein
MFGGMHPDGMNAQNAMGLVGENSLNLGIQVGRGDLEEAPAAERPSIAMVDEGRAVVVQGTQIVDGAEYVQKVTGGMYEGSLRSDTRCARTGSTQADRKRTAQTIRDYMPPRELVP